MAGRFSGGRAGRADEPAVAGRDVYFHPRGRQAADCADEPVRLPERRYGGSIGAELATNLEQWWRPSLRLWSMGW